MEIINYDTLLEQYAGVAFEKQYNLSEMVGDRDWQIDMEEKSLSFGDDIHFSMQIIGSYAFDSGTWLWAWANEASNIPANLLEETNALKQFGEEHKIEFLTMSEYKIEPTDVHALGLIASGKFNSSAYYAGNYGSGILLVTINDFRIENIAYNEQARILSVVPELTSFFAVNHKRTVENYLLAKEYSIHKDNNKLSAQKEDNFLVAEFDEHDRLLKINGEIKQ